MVVEILDLWLNRSRNLPLHISFVGDVNWMLDYSYWEPIFERAKTCSERWETLRLEMSRKAWCHFFEGFRCPPSLKGIRLVAPAGEDREWELDSPAEFIRPTLHGLEELHIQNVSWQEVDIAWENLIVFEAGPWDFFGFELLLSHAPRLKKCRILYMGSVFHSPTVHSHLEDLELWNSSSISLEDVIRQFTFPSLKRLVYRPGTSRFSSQVPPVGARMDRLQSFVVRSQCRLIELEIHIPFKTTADLAKVLAHLPSLECLTLSTDRRYRDNSALWLSDISFAEHLKFSVLSRLLPQLKVFRIEGKRAFSWDALIAFLKPPHKHVTSKRNTCVHIQFASYLPSQERSENYIDRDVVLRLKRRERKWKGAVSLDIKHRDSGEDWMQASLDYHEQASSISTRVDFSGPTLCTSS
ncbi:hypothetical protein CVT26_004801 [Gymnopilus dilepis]|uniref:F-box domain-containing protein n=1 Tax=Gymnopilus dilepis TaxID=231916 RepID=A0A409XZM7_9AGAR|nr:hypothetical protein CVT26_004801 [Gymnopilus dilepis]